MYRAVDKIAEFGSQALEELLIVLNEPPSYQAIVGIAQTLGKIEDKRAIHPLITALRYEGHNSYETKNSIALALKKLTGNDYGDDCVRWEEWWDTQNQ